MNKKFLMLIGVILLGVLAIILSNLLSSYSDTREKEKLKALELQHNKIMQEISSKPDTIEEPEISPSVKESELYDEEQIYFQGIEILYDYFKFGQVEDIKQKVQVYIHQYIDKGILDCKLLDDSIRQKDNVINFNLEVKNAAAFEVQVNKDSEGNIIDITILHDYK